MVSARSFRRKVFTGLSGRLLALVAGFVLLVEALVYLPSISRFRQEYLEDKVERAYLASLALRASPDQRVAEPLANDLLRNAGAHAIVLKLEDRRMLMLAEHPLPTVDVTIDVPRQMMFDWVAGALGTLVSTENRILRVIGEPARSPEATVEVLLEEQPLREAMLAYSVRILRVSLAITSIGAILGYLVLQFFLVRPITRITESMVRFREDPGDEAHALVPSRRGDEIGIAERELVAMQQQLRASLRQNQRLAVLGAAVARIHHDLRNLLATALLGAERLSVIDDPRVRKVAPRLLESIDRSVALSRRTIDFLREERPPLRTAPAAVWDLVADATRAGAAAERLTVVAPIVDGVPESAAVQADRDQLYRVFCNIAVNAAQAGARSLRIEARAHDGRLLLDISDDGPGIPANIRECLFQPFGPSARAGGSGLGLAIAREIVEAHRGEIELAGTAAGGTTFRLALPLVNGEADQPTPTAAREARTALAPSPEIGDSSRLRKQARGHLDA